MKQTILLFLILNLIIGYAKAVSAPRLEYILAKDHGWIELNMLDESIPSMTKKESEELSEVNPPRCRIKIDLNNEPFLNDSIYPYGENTPYRIETGFRFAVPIGEMELVLKYSGCDSRNDEREIITIILPLSIFVQKDMVLVLQFDGDQLHDRGVKENKVVTLEDIHQRLEAIAEKTTKRTP